MANTDAGILLQLKERALTPEDAAKLVPLSIEAGWNQMEADWTFMLQSGEGKGMTDRAGRFAACALIVPLGPAVSWISMVVTAKPWRRRGLGTRLLKDRIADVRAAGKVAGLDATEHGKPIYEALGFRPLWELSRWHVKRVPAKAAPPPGVELRAMRRQELKAIAMIDKVLTGLEREHVLRHLYARAPGLAYVATEASRLRGYVLGRDGRFATQIGPIVATDDATARALAARAVASAPPPFILDVPDRHKGIQAWINEAGGEAQRHFWRMTLGDAPGLTEDRPIFALAGPELA